MTRRRELIPGNIRGKNARVRHDLGTLMGKFVGWDIDIDDNQKLADAFDKALPPCCETCGAQFSFARLMDWRGPAERSPWWTCPRFCEPCLIDEEMSERMSIARKAPVQPDQPSVDVDTI